jgi:hypothetical protein
MQYAHLNAAQQDILLTERSIILPSSGAHTGETTKMPTRYAAGQEIVARIPKDTVSEETVSRDRQYPQSPTIARQGKMKDSYQNQVPFENPHIFAKPVNAAQTDARTAIVCRHLGWLPTSVSGVDGVIADDSFYNRVTWPLGTSVEGINHPTATDQEGLLSDEMAYGSMKVPTSVYPPLVPLAKGSYRSIEEFPADVGQGSEKRPHAGYQDSETGLSTCPETTPTTSFSEPEVTGLARRIYDMIVERVRRERQMGGY